MKAAVYYETGAPDVFRYEDVADPTPGPGEILIDVEAISIEVATPSIGSAVRCVRCPTSWDTRRPARCPSAVKASPPLRPVIESSRPT